MRDIIATLPQFQEQRSKFSVHLSMAQQFMDIFEKRKLPSVANVEQVRPLFTCVNHEFDYYPVLCNWSDCGGQDAEDIS